MVQDSDLGCTLLAARAWTLGPLSSLSLHLLLLCERQIDLSQSRLQGCWEDLQGSRESPAVALSAQQTLSE